MRTRVGRKWLHLTHCVCICICKTRPGWEILHQTQRICRCICICICVFAKPNQGGEGERGGNDCINIYSRRKRLQGSGNQYKLIWNEPLDCDFYSDAGENTIDCISETGKVNCSLFCMLPNDLFSSVLWMLEKSNIVHAFEIMKWSIKFYMISSN